MSQRILMLLTQRFLSEDVTIQDDDQTYNTTTTTTTTTLAEETSEEQTISAYFVLFSALLSVVLILSKLLHDHPRVASIVPEAGMILMTGVFFGAILALFVGGEGGGGDSDTTKQQQNGNSDNNNNSSEEDMVAVSLLSFSPEVFFLVLLPPIIFNSGYHLRKELFFRHLTPICLFAVVGTTISALVIAIVLQVVCQWTNDKDFAPQFTELLTFGALLSATDPVTTLVVFQEKRVDPQLFYLVFGESVLNDAVGLVLFRAFQDFVVEQDDASHVAVGISEFLFGFLYDSLVSPALGLLLGLATALMFKHLDMRTTPLLELALFILIMYVPFLVAQLLDLSGIVCILVTGLTAKTYVVPNLSQFTVNHADVLFRLVSHLAEAAIFLELGLSVFGLKGSIHWAFIGWTVVACLVARAANVYPISFVYNRHIRLQTLQGPHSHHHDKELVPQGSGDGGDGLRGDDATSEDALRPETTMESQQRKPHRPPALELTNLPHRSKSAQEGANGSDNPKDEPDKNNRTKQTEEVADAPEATAEPSHFSFPTTAGTPVGSTGGISANKQHMLWFSGLRGAVAYACVRSFPNTFGHADDFTVTTMMIVLLSVFCLGSTTECMLNVLHIEINVDEGTYMEHWYSNEHQRQAQDSWFVRWQYVLYRCVVRGANTTGHMSVPPVEEGARDEGAIPNSPVRTHDSDRAGELQRTPSSEFRPHINTPPRAHSEVDDEDEPEEFEDEIRSGRSESVFDYGSKSSKV